MAQTEQLLVYTFNSARGADAARDALTALDHRLASLKLDTVAVVRKRADGQVSFRETHDIWNRAGLAGVLPLVGGTLGYLACRQGLLKQSPGVSATIGAALGFVAAVAVNVVDLGFADDSLRRYGATLEADASAVVVRVPAVDEEMVRSVLGSAGGTPVQDSLDPALLQALTGARTLT